MPRTGWRRRRGAFTNSVFGLLRASVIVGAVAAAGGTLDGYDARSGATFAWITQALIAPVALFSWSELALRVRTGDIAVDLARPVDLQLQYLAGDYGRAAYQIVPRGLPPLVIGALTVGLALPAAPTPISSASSRSSSPSESFSRAGSLSTWSRSGWWMSAV